MRQGQGHFKRRQRSSRIAPITRSQSLDVITVSHCSDDYRYLMSSRCGVERRSDPAASLRGSHLPPLGRKNRRSSAGYPPENHPEKDEYWSTSSMKDIWEPPLASQPREGWAEGSGSENDVVNVFIPAGQAAGIVFQWTDAPTAGLGVVGVTDGSLAARHGGITPGMQLVEISRQQVAEMDQAETMRYMRIAVSKPRVLTLARVAQLPPSVRHIPTPGSRPEDAVAGFKDRSHKSWPSAALSTFDTDAEKQRLRSFRGKSSGKSLVNPRPQSATSSSDGNTSSASDSTTTTAGSTIKPTPDDCTSWPYHRARQERTLALRFVGSREDLTLFDRDHVLGLKNRDIEFVPSRRHSKVDKAYSRRSLGELTRDWRNDPCSTPARRRRLINDVCKVVAWSYTVASVFRVAEFRRQEVVAARIQAAARMWSARRYYFVKTAERRSGAALTLQLGWLSFNARRLVSILREKMIHARRLEEAEYNKQLAEESRERHRCKEEKERIEKETLLRDKRWREKDVAAIIIQKRFRSLQDYKLMVEARQKRVQQRGDDILQPTKTIQASFQQQNKAKRHRREPPAQTPRRSAVAASCRIQQAWRRHNPKLLYGQKYDERSTCSVTSTARNEFEPTSGRNLHVKQSVNGYLPGSQNEHLGATKISEGTSSGGKGSTRGALSKWDSWFTANPPLEAEISLEGLGASSVITAGGVRPRTAAGAIESTVLDTAPHLDGRLPAGMMAVRVRRGSEETSLVTAIVLTEGNEEVKPKTVESGNSDSTPPQRAMLPSGPIEGTGVTDTIMQSSIAIYSAGNNDRALFHDHRESEGRWIKKNQGKTVPFQVAPETSTTDFMFPGQDSAGEMGTNPAVSPAVGSGSGNSRVVDTVTMAASGQKTTTAISVVFSEDDPAVSGLSAVVPDKSISAQNAGASDIVAKQLIMEDSQVYLGCSSCGVKYLVEAVNPRLPESKKGQPSPEVLYLCTTCGGILRNDEDGRWRRRRRPSSAPPVEQRKTSFVGASWRFDRSKGGHSKTAGRDCKEGRLGASRHEERIRAKERADSSAKLRNTHCARTIQHAYRDFRHRQYLHDWAFSRLRRWLLGRVQARRRSQCRLLFLRATIMLQSSARAASARARCLALRAARLRLWVDRAAALYEADDFSPSPVAAELMREINMPPPPPKQSRSQHSNPPGIKGRRSLGGRALAEALAPRMGHPPPGCPEALDVDWGEWGENINLVFPPRGTSGGEGVLQDDGMLECNIVDK